MRILLFANGEIDGYDFIRPYLSGGDQLMIICCDGGLRHSDALGITPDLCIGDFDSAPRRLVEHYRAQGVEFAVHPQDKDQTDLELAVEHAIEVIKAHTDSSKNRSEPDGGTPEIVIFGWHGGRFDHELTNVQILFRIISEGVQAMLADGSTVVSLAGGLFREHSVDGREADLLSLIPLTPEVTGIVTDGLQYPLRNETLYMGRGRGMSNVLTGSRATVRIETGILMMVYNGSLDAPEL